MTEYYSSSGGRYGLLWKREDSTEYFFSEKELNWIECKCSMIMPSFSKVSEEYALDYIRDEKKLGSYEKEVTPFRYILSDSDFLYAIDIYENEYDVLPDKTLKPAPGGTIDPYWGGIDESEIDKYLNPYGIKSGDA